MYYLGKKERAIVLNKEAMELVETSNYIMKKNSVKSQLIENNESLCGNVSKTQHEVYSQIHTKDGLFNLPCI